MKYVAYDGRYYCYLSDNGIRVQRLGCSHEKPRQAYQHTAPDQYVSPLRLPVESPAPVQDSRQADDSTRRQTASPRNTPPLSSPRRRGYGASQ